MTFRNTTAAIALAGLLGVPGALAADPACRDASFCPDLQLVRPCQATSCDRADLFRRAGQKEELIVDQGLDEPGSSMPCSRLRIAQDLYISAVAEGDPTALADRDRVREKLKKLCPFRGW